SLLTGESLPRSKKLGDAIIAGSINQHSPIRVKVTAIAQQTVLAGIISMQDSALAVKPRAQQVIDKIAGYFIAAILIIAVITFFSWWWIQPEHALWVTLAVLVATCPCALSLAAPTVLTGIIHRLNRDGILLKGADVLESVKQLDKVCLDKTGTLTEGQFRLVERQDSIDPKTVNHIVSGLELFSEHPLSVPLSQLSDAPAKFTHVSNEMGAGLQGELDGEVYRVGSERFIQQWHPEFKALNKYQVIVASKKQVLAQFRVEDQVRDGAAETIEWLKENGYQPIILSGDSESRVHELAKELGIAEYHSGLKPEEKLAFVTEQQQLGHTVWMVGDGINDSPVLAKADLSMTFSKASDLAQTAADVVLMSESLNQIKVVIESALKTRKVMQQNFTWALVYNVSILPVAAIGMVAPWAAALGMSLSSLLVIGNSLRLYRK
ncbi:MAG: cadmium-translocating P-type ATPase, partial [Idiomarina sp.]|nr:cadmium-translocating P-type ATPase [Idiomarina sp.]